MFMAIRGILEETMTEHAPFLGRTREEVSVMDDTPPADVAEEALPSRPGIFTWTVFGVGLIALIVFLTLY